MATLVCVVGPTAAGKTAFALALAERLTAMTPAHPVEIVSCDSIAVYRGCDVGAAKPTAAERARVPHHLVDVADPDEEFTAARWAEAAERAIAAVRARGARPLVVGGTGLYLRALVDGLAPLPAADPSLRAKLREEARALGWPALHARLAAVDAEAAARIHPTDPVRIERALEVHALTGAPLSALHARHRREHPPLAARTILVDPGLEALDARIAARTDALLGAGLVDETRQLAAGWGRHVKPLGGVGYKESLAHLDGALSAAALPEAIRTATRQFARRQRNWFRKYETARLLRTVAAPDSPSVIAAAADEAAELLDDTSQPSVNHG